ncbi:MAG: hypothetical protein ACR2MP_05025 [Streptosporangiaceae bacterium]
MSRDPRRQEQLRRHMAYMTDDRTPDEEKGRVILALLGHAVAYLLLTAADAIWVVAMAARVWRRREAGLSRAVRTNVHRPTLAVLLSAHLLYEILRRAVLARLNRGAANTR